MGLNQIVLLATEVGIKPLSERMNTALLNSIMGLTVVFAALWVICGLISCFKIINKVEAKFKKKKELAASQDATLEPEQVVTMEVEEEELSDDLELVAVITAAINSYEEAQGNVVPANGLMVKSIKKVNRSRWLNA